MIQYVDSSAWGKLVREEAETEAMLDHLEDVRREGGSFVSSRLLATELHRLGHRWGLSSVAIDDALDEVAMQVPTTNVYSAAGGLPGQHLRSLDALHVAAALEVGADAFVTYDDRQAEAARAAGIRVVAPGTMAR